MFKQLTFLGAALVIAVLVTGCAGAQKKLGRGINNSLEPVRLAEWQRTVEQSKLYDAPHHNGPTAMVNGFTRTMARAGLGIYEIVTFPIPNQFGPAEYDPIWTDYLAPNPQYPDSYKPGLPDSPLFRTDSSLEFSGGEVAPMIPGSRFRVFDN